ncbi:XRE family transcriptional regulator [Streptococcus oralis]|jgi:repressor (phage associated)|uniref:XRE family transcriptional regulator n=1 Tax=Streptococcus oralis TaxID=1303 RepID=UPI001C1E9B33|nr:S24 family peptidase [Streptococcus oralis]MBU6872525.1 helix-turn-helix domain-containing protein [Streptococcus oralis]MDK7118178.1 S24 family peptidase [Streptococcus oralis]DAW42790.1 MAG TPA: Repressor protein CI [Caudoviricetes sp.]
MRTNEEIISLIQEEAKKKGMSMSELARRVGIAKSTMSRYFNKTREFPLNKADDFARIFNITPEFLLGIQKENKERPEILTIYNQLEEPRQEKVLDFANAQLDEQESSKVASIFEKVSNEDYIIDYVEGLVAAGHGTLQEDNLHMEVKLRSEDVPEDYDTIAKVAGDSMEPLIEDNDLLFIKVTSQVDINSIGIFQVNGKNFVKKLKRDYDGSWYLQSLNSGYEEIHLSENDDIRTIGEVVDIYKV